MYKQLTKCLIDMEGVLVDFTGGCCKIHNRPDPYGNGQNRGEWSIEKIWDMSEEEFWAPIDEDFWYMLEPLPMAKELVGFLEEEFEGKVGILSTPRLKVGDELHKGCVDGKVAWLNDHFPHLIKSANFTHEKWLSGSPTTLLIDDNDRNVNKFRDPKFGGGHAYLVPRPWNSAHQEEFDLDDLIEFIDEINFSMCKK